MTLRIHDTINGKTSTEPAHGVELQLSNFRKDKYQSGIYTGLNPIRVFMQTFEFDVI